MTKDPLYEQLREISWRRKLTTTEQAQLSAFLAEHPEAQADWDSEAGLSEALSGLADVPVASNFTARAVAAAQSSEAGSKSGEAFGWQHAPWWHRWLPKAALAAVVVGAGLLSYNHLQQSHRAEVVRSLTAVSQIPSVPSPDILKDFDTIAAMSVTPPADEELLKVMQ